MGKQLVDRYMDASQKLQSCGRDEYFSVIQKVKIIHIPNCLYVNINVLSIFFNFDNYGLQVSKIEKTYLQNIIINSNSKCKILIYSILKLKILLFIKYK